MNCAICNKNLLTEICNIGEYVWSYELGSCEACHYNIRKYNSGKIAESYNFGFIEILVTLDGEYSIVKIYDYNLKNIFRGKILELKYEPMSLNLISKVKKLIILS